MFVYDDRQAGKGEKGAAGAGGLVTNPFASGGHKARSQRGSNYLEGPKEMQEKCMKKRKKARPTNSSTRPFFQHHSKPNSSSSSSSSSISSKRENNNNTTPDRSRRQTSRSDWSAAEGHCSGPRWAPAAPRRPARWSVWRLET